MMTQLCAGSDHDARRGYERRLAPAARATPRAELEPKLEPEPRPISREVEQEQEREQEREREQGQAREQIPLPAARRRPRETWRRRRVAAPRRPLTPARR